jgi:hypothetical protein
MKPLLFATLVASASAASTASAQDFGVSGSFSAADVVSAGSDVAFITTIDIVHGVFRHRVADDWALRGGAARIGVNEWSPGIGGAGKSHSSGLVELHAESTPAAAEPRKRRAENARTASGGMKYDVALGSDRTGSVFADRVATKRPFSRFEDMGLSLLW